MAVQITATPDGLPRLRHALIALRLVGAAPRPLWKALAAYGESSTRLRFRKQVDPDGRPWKPSMRATQGSGRTLVDKARLLRSITHNADNNGGEWGTNVAYAAIHQFGGTIKAKGRALRFQIPGGGFVTTKRVTMPARAFFGVNAEDGREMLALTGEVLDQVQRARKG